MPASYRRQSMPGQWWAPPPPPPSPWPPGWEQAGWPPGGDSRPIWTPPPPPPRRHVRIAIVALLILGIVATLAGATAGVVAYVNGQRSLNIPAKVDPSVVDVNVVLGEGGGAAGTGIIISEAGEVLTNHHVIDGASEITVQIAGSGPDHQVTVLGDDPANDVALLQIKDVSGLTPVSLGDSSRVAVGDSVTAIGNALGRGGTPVSTTGFVTALDQTETAVDSTGANSETLTGLIRMSAPIQPGDSGGPLINALGQVIGMDTLGPHGFRGMETINVGFAIPINTAMNAVSGARAGKSGG